MRETEMLLRFLRYTAGFSALCWDKSKQMLEEIEKKNCFSRQVQPLLTANGLQAVFEQLKPGVLYEVEDLLGIHVFFFLFQDVPVMAGPFVTAEWSEDSIPEKKRLVDAGLPASYLLPYKLYYCSYCALNQSAAVRLVTGAVTSLLPDAPPYMYQRFSGNLGHSLPETYVKENFDFDSAVHQFELEKQFYKLVEEGHTEAALEMWKRMKQIPIAEQLLPFDMTQLLANTTGLRLTLRMVAEQGGAHAAVVYALSLSYAQKIFSIQNAKDLEKITPAMIRDFSDAVRSAHTTQYSPAIKNVVNYLDLHISEKIDMRHLAALADCGTDNLSQRFKTETGLTIAQYLAKERCRIAGDLLRKTDLPVQKISAHVGYMDNNYFVKVFKKYMGDTPTDYRNKLRP